VTDLLSPSSVSSNAEAPDVSVGMGRRSFLTRSAAVAVGATGAALGFEALAANPVQGRRRGDGGYGELRPVRDENTGEELLSLPRGFEYISFGWTGEVMDDGIPTPSLHDGMAAFGSAKLVRLVRNHEQASGPAFASGMTYDPAAAGGTTNLVFDTRWGRLDESYASLAGTIRNCAGGPTPWGSWLSCEETEVVQGEYKHGYVFDVPSDGVSTGQPIVGMGRFSHEAAAVDPETGIVYLSEDATPSGLYRFVPRRYGDMSSGGKLQMLKLGDETIETYADGTGTRYPRVRWVRIGDPDATEVSCVEQGMAKGGAVFSRGEGMWYADGKVYFISTDGGPAGEGQVFELDLRRPMSFKVLYASPSVDVLNAPDNITVSPRGGIVLCEDGSGPSYLQGLAPDGTIFPFALNNLNQSEWAGATFQPGRGKWLFVNIQNPGITFAITGPWNRGAL
jgi:secreted PhoX family phosphatase